MSQNDRLKTVHSRANRANIRTLAFFFLFYGQGPIRDYFYCRLAHDLQTLATFYLFAQIQRNQRPRLRYDLLYPVIQPKHVFESFKF